MGSRIAVDANENSDYDEIRLQCFLKQKTFNSHMMNLKDGMHHYNLLFKSMQPAYNLPGTETALTLKSYQHAIGLSYGHLTFILNDLSCGKIYNFMYTILCKYYITGVGR